MGVSIPSSFDFGIDLGLDISGIPTNYNIGITQLPKINLGMDIKVDPLEIKPLDMSFEIKPLPPMRVWLPMDYKICLALFGAELASVRLCGQGQVITEPYVANPCECRPRNRGIVAQPGTEAAAVVA
jgi:hypothetical protein